MISRIGALKLRYRENICIVGLILLGVKQALTSQDMQMKERRWTSCRILLSKRWNTILCQAKKYRGFIILLLLRLEETYTDMQAVLGAYKSAWYNAKHTHYS